MSSYFPNITRHKQAITIDVTTKSGRQRRNGTGEGCHIEIAIIDSPLAMLSYRASTHFVTGQILSRRVVAIGGALDVPDGRRDRVVGSPIKVNGEPTSRANPPAPGEHTDESLDGPPGGTLIASPRLLQTEHLMLRRQSR